MSVTYPDDYPKSIYEALSALKEIREEDIDYSDIPPISDNAIITPIGQKFIEMGKRNLAKLNQMLREREHPVTNR
ncbi:MAG: hypothetical protein IJT58_00970 [Synergistaceae bacterium]|nr:hypothetical protein [Synergistaceae bacterium]